MKVPVPTVIRLAALLPVLVVTSLPAQERVRFNRDIRPILSENCLACHGPDANKREADLRLDVEDIAKKAAIVAGNPDDSELIARITSVDPQQQMPPADSGRQLTAEQIELLRRWIEQGAKYEAHWAFLPPERPQAPDVANTADVRNAIDRFVTARLESEGLQPSPAATREELIRRVSLDLIGLPPTPDEVDAFVNDSSPNAWGKVVDRLLASDRYGEHMARYWLDAARYADTNGYQYDLEREQWVWRDWVIHAFNSNMPFNRFTIEQLAGDLLPEATDQQKLATAFHRNHPITIEGGVIDEEYRTEYVVDRVVTTSTVWMGLTMMCGRCHDHKYDPITQREFYQVFAFFNQVPEKGNNGFNPKLSVASPLRASEIERTNAAIAALDTRFERVIAETSGRIEEWSREVSDDVSNQWDVIVPETRRSQGGADLVVQADQSILATGKNAPTELYELVFPCETPIHAIRLEALTHESFVGGGTGRGSNGNFVLSEFQVAATAPDSPDEYRPVKLSAAEADYSQNNYHISGAIDGKIDRTGWAVDGNTKRENRTAVFTLAEPLNPDGAGLVRVQLHHQWGGKHHIGRFRLSLALRPVRTIPPDVANIARLDVGSRNDEQRRRLNEYLVERFGSDGQRALVSEIVAARKHREELTKVPATMVMTDMPNARATHILERGEYDKPRDRVTAGTPAALPPMPDDAPRNRLGFARWLVAPNHPLTSRVIVNRFWHRMFGTGIVSTVEDFGSQGEWPSHPELLDWLAVEFVESGWDVKALLKTIVMSATYRRSSRIVPSLEQRDPDNRLLARGPRSRLDAEVIRDSALFVCGLLKKQLGGPSVFPYHPPGLWQEINNRPGYSRVYKRDSGSKLYRRSLYTFWKRTVPPPSMAAFDAPEREYCVVRRSRTNTPLQAFVMLHDPQFVEAARHLAVRLLTHRSTTDADRIEFGFRLCLGRSPNAAEAAVLQSTLDDCRRQYSDDHAAAEQLLSVGESRHDPDQVDTAELAAWTTIGRMLLNLSEFVTKG